MRTLLMLRGAPGCGKSTWIRENGLEPYALSADGIRMLCAGPKLAVDGEWIIDPSNDTVVWKILFQMLETRMQNGAFTVIDATNSKSTEMNKYKALCDEYRYRMFCVDMTDIPIEEVKRRNLQREPLKRVPDAAIDKMYSRFATQKIPSGITVIRPNQLDKVFFHKIDLSDYERIHVIGDIHGCSTALAEYMSDAGWSRNECYIFVGDYIDRGVENVSVLRFLLSVCEKQNVFLLEGNHERWLWMWANDRVSGSKEFELITRQQLEDANIDKKSVRKFYRRLGQCAWFTYHGKEFFVSHAGISRLPENLTLLDTQQMIRGVGTYNDFEKVEDAWLRNTPDNCIQIHGHRNTKMLPIKVNEKNYNLEGRIEFGGCLRVVQITPDGITPIEIRNTVYNREKENGEYLRTDEKEISVANLILEMRGSKLINEKRFGNISSFNFTRQAFYDKAWNSQTTKARGLYINIPKAKIVARSYEKFFNLGEREETKLENLQDVLQFPVTAYVKENGFLGIVAYDEDDDGLLMTTKSTPDGDNAEWFREDLLKQLGDARLGLMRQYSKDNNCSFVFECVDIKRDPHIIEYQENHLFLLDIVYNDIQFRKLPFDEMCRVADEIGIQHKELADKLETWQEFFDWYYKVTDEDFLYDGRHIEGFVIEDQAGYMVKIKLAYYNFWKYMRSIAQETIRVGYLTHAKLASLTTPTANYFYGWLKNFRQQVIDNDLSGETQEEILSAIPRDICSLRRMFYNSEEGKQFMD